MKIAVYDCLIVVVVVAAVVIVDVVIVVVAAAAAAVVVIAVGVGVSTFGTFVTLYILSICIYRTRVKWNLFENPICSCFDIEYEKSKK